MEKIEFEFENGEELEKYEYKVSDERLKAFFKKCLMAKDAEYLVQWLLDIADTKELMYEFDDEIHKEFYNDAEQEYIDALEHQKEEF